MKANGYFNPHLLVHCDFKRRLQRRFFRALFASARVHEVNDRGTQEESQRLIRDIVEIE